MSNKIKIKKGSKIGIISKILLQKLIGKHQFNHQIDCFPNIFLLLIYNSVQKNVH